MENGNLPNKSANSPSFDMAMPNNSQSVGFKVVSAMETPEKIDWNITPETTISNIESHPLPFLEQALRDYSSKEHDPNDTEVIKSNMLVYVLKRIQETDIEKFDEIMEDPSIVEQLGKEPGLRDRLESRIENLEYLETENYIFLLPKDQWDEKKIMLPKNEEADYIAPTNLTAILKAPVIYDWNKETNGEIKKLSTVYGEDWVGREIRHFPCSIELFEAEEKLLKPNGYHIPKSWEPIVSRIAERIGLHLNGNIYVNSNNANGEKELSSALRDEKGLNLAFSGYVWAGKLKNVGKIGFFWSATAAGGAYGLGFNEGAVTPENYDDRSGAQSVRCVSGPEQ